MEHLRAKDRNGQWQQYVDAELWVVAVLDHWGTPKIERAYWDKEKALSDLATFCPNRLHYQPDKYVVFRLDCIRSFPLPELNK